MVWSAVFTDPAFDPAAFVDRRLVALGITLTGLSALGARNIVVLSACPTAPFAGVPPQAMPVASFMSAHSTPECSAWCGFWTGNPTGCVASVSTLFNDILADAVGGGPRFGITNVTGTCRRLSTDCLSPSGNRTGFFCRSHLLNG